MLKNISPYLLLVLIWALSSQHSEAQRAKGIQNEDAAVMVTLGYGPFISAGDLNDRFGNGFSLGGNVSYMPGKSSWQLGIEGYFGFGDEVKEDVLYHLRTQDGLLIGTQRQPADVQLRQRMLFIGVTAGYTLALGENHRSGVHLRSALGYFRHHIRIQDDPVQFVAALSSELRGGYDRLTAGPALHQFIGFQQLAVNRRLNFFLGADLMLGLTKAQREYDYAAARVPSTDTRLDVTVGLRAAVILPFYFGEGREIFYK